jgi:hypothetical protein
VPFSAQIEGHGLSSEDHVNRSSNQVTYSKTIVQGGHSVAMASAQLNFASNVKESSITDYTAKVIGENLISSGNESAWVTSVQRNAGEQAAAMLPNIEAKGVQSQLELYGKNTPGGQVVNSYADAKKTLGALSLTGGFKLSNPKAAVLSVMTNKINEFGVSRVSNHGGDPSKLNVLDIRPPSLSNPGGFVKSVSSDPRVSKIINDFNKDPAYHTEVPQKKQ